VDRLWTPWRREFVEGAKDTASGETVCFLCANSAAQDDRANMILFRAPCTFVMLNLYPYNSGHLMIAPYAHGGDLARLDSSIAEELMRMTQRSIDVLQRAYPPEGFNVGMNLGKSAGAGVPDHLHIHVVPRWAGDTSFMPVVAGTKVLPETLDQTYERLEPFFR
jgi:ATP adenylyltransferase